MAWWIFPIRFPGPKPQAESAEQLERAHLTLLTASTNTHWLGHPNLSCTHLSHAYLAAERRHTIIEADAPPHYSFR